ncbi:MAG: tripartite tricarboxylate transporter TctB family protein, partial [Candidatus Aminicenantaceae bacterium]
MRKANIIISIILMVFSLIYFYLTTLLPDRNLPHTLGSDFVPRLLVICLFILTLFLFFQNLMSKKEDKESDRKIKDRPESVFNILLTIFVITL